MDNFDILEVNFYNFFKDCVHDRREIVNVYANFFFGAFGFVKVIDRAYYKCSDCGIEWPDL